MPQYKLIYFDMRGRAELSRMLFALAGQKYEDVRIKKEDWPGEEDNYIFGRLPVLEVDGTQYAQSMAISSFLARRFGFHGSTDVEVLEVDQVLGIVGDIVAAFVRLLGFHGSTDVEVLEVDQVLGIVGDIVAAFVRLLGEVDEARKAEMVTENNETKLPMFLGCFQTVLKNNKNGFYVGDKLGYADVAAFEILDATIDQSMVDRFPLVKANAEMVKANKSIAEWLAKRPLTRM